MGLFDAAMGNAAENLVGAGIQTGGQQAGRPRLRRALFIITLLLAIWSAVASAFLWSTERLPNVNGLVQFAATSGPGWVLATPICATLLALVLIIPAQGRVSIAALLAAAAFGFGLASVAILQQDGHSAVSVLILVSVLLLLLLPLLALLLAFGDAPPIDSFAARLSLVYWGRLGHLRALKQYGLTHGLKISEPTGSLQPLVLTGMYDSLHPFSISSAAYFRLSTRNSSSFTLTAWMGSPRDIVAFRISSAPPSKQLGYVLAGQTGARLQRKLHYLIVPEASLPVPPGLIEQMGQMVEAARPIFRPSTSLRRPPSVSATSTVPPMD